MSAARIDYVSLFDELQIVIKVQQCVRKSDINPSIQL